MINLSLSRIFSTEIPLTEEIVFAHNARATIKRRNPPTAPNPNPSFDTFFAVISLYKFTTNSPIPTKVRSQKNTVENTWSKVFVVVGSIPKDVNCVGLEINL